MNGNNFAKMRQRAVDELSSQGALNDPSHLGPQPLEMQLAALLHLPAEFHFALLVQLRTPLERSRPIPNITNVWET